MFYTSAFDDFPFQNRYGRQSSRYLDPFQQTRTEAEEAAFHRYLWMKRKEEEQEAYARRRKLREERAIQERQRHARLMREEEMRRQRQSEEEQIFYGSDDDDDIDNNDEAGYHIFRGQDGQLYYVRTPLCQRHRPMKQQKEWRQHQNKQQDVHGNTKKEMPQRLFNDSEDAQPSDGNESPSDDSCYDVVESLPSIHPTLVVKSEGSKSQDNISNSRVGLDTKKPSRRRRAAIIVEDASDSENEDEYKSPWRNRRPSPGQWMEPIEIYD